MCHRKSYVIPTRMHYDVYRVWNNETPHFMCSTAKENDAFCIIKALKHAEVVAGNTWGVTQYKVRARATKEHTIHAVTV